MKQWLRGLGFTVGILGSMTTSAQLIDTIAAMVDQEVILLSEIRGQVYSQIEVLQQSGIPQSEFNKQVLLLMDEALEESIETKILYREANRFAIEVHDSEVEAKIKGFRANFDTEEEFMAYLENTGDSLSEHRKEQRKQIMAQIMAGSKMAELRKSVIIAESDVSEYYASHKSDFLQPEQIRIRQIMLRAKRNTDERTQAIATLKQLRQSIVDGADFVAVAKEHSQDPAAVDGGLIGWQQRGQLVPAIEDATFPLKKGEVSEIVETQFGVLILRVDDRREASTIALKDARGHIEPQLRAQKSSALYDKWMSDLRRHSNVRIYLNK